MRIGINFHTFDEYISGVEYYGLGLMNALLEIDLHNDYIVFTNCGALIRRHIDRHENLKIVELTHIKTRLMRILWEHIQLPKAAQKERLNVLHCLSYISPLRRSTARYVVTIHDTIAVEHPHWCRPGNALYFNLCMKRSLRNSCRIITPSKATAQALARNFATDTDRIRVIYPGIDAIFNTKANGLKSDRVRRRYNLPHRFILYVGNIEPKKNLRTLLTAQRAIGKKGMPLKLVIAGKRTWGSKSELDEIEKRVLANNIVLTGYVDRADLPFLYQMADVFVFPSLYEGFGFPPLEAMACGIPVVASSSGALAETLIDAAVVVKTDDVPTLADAIIRLTRDTRFRDKYIRRGLARCKDFSWQQTARQTLAVYKEAVNSDGK